MQINIADCEDGAGILDRESREGLYGKGDISAGKCLSGAS